jgi:ribosomal protein L22
MSSDLENDGVAEGPESTSDSEVTASRTSESDIDAGSGDDSSAEVGEGDDVAAGSEAEPVSAEPVAEAEGDELEPDAEEIEAEVVAESEEPEDDDESEDDDDSDDEPEADATAVAEPEAPAKPGRRRRRGAAVQEPAAPAAPSGRRQRGRREPGAPRPVVRAQAKYVRSSARKARLVCDNIRGKTVEEARAILAVTPRAVARDWSKLLESAVANAEHNHELVGEDLYVKAVHADEGPTIKRFRPRAMGRATQIRKRTAHLTILLTPKD